MAERKTGLRRVLGVPAAYALAQRAIGSTQGSMRFVAERVRPSEARRVLDLGCGPGLLLLRLPDIEYVGFDPSEAYIESAREQFGDRGTFVVGTADDLDLDQIGTFDLAVARGVMHHLDDDQVVSMVALAAKVLEPGGRFVTLDPAYVDDQRWISRQLVSRDRGANVRKAADYEALVRTSFDRIDLRLYDDLLRVPYDHASIIAYR